MKIIYHQIQTTQTTILTTTTTVPSTTTSSVIVEETTNSYVMGGINIFQNKELMKIYKKVAIADINQSSNR